MHRKRAADTSDSRRVDATLVVASAPAAELKDSGFDSFSDERSLLATTILVAGASVAAAEVTLSGSARMGIVDDGGAAGAVFNSRARVSFSMSGETDTGLSFGASFRADNASDANSGTAGSVFISGAFGKITMGDNDGAAQQSVGQVDGVGYTGNGDLNEIAYITGNDDESVMYSYTMDAFTINASVGQTGASDERGVGVAYAGDGFGLSLGYEEDSVDGSHVVVGASASFSSITVKAVYGSFSPLGGGANQNQYAVSATYSADALSATVFTRSSLADVQASGVGIGYDLGGGAAFAAGYSKAENADGRFDAGVTFSF